MNYNYRRPTLKSTLAGLLSLVIAVESVPAAPFVSSASGAFSLALSPTAGYVTETFVPQGRLPQGAPDVVFIQDLHANRSVQLNISRILRSLKSAGWLPERIGIEGATGPVETAYMQRYPDVQVRKLAADYLVSQAEMAGDMHYVVTEGKGSLYGIETPEVYDSVMELYRGMHQRREDLSRELALLKKSLKYLAKDKEETVRSNTALLQQDVDVLSALVRQEVPVDELKPTLRKAMLAVDHLQMVLPTEKARALLEPVSASVNYYVLALMRDEELFKNLMTLRGMEKQTTSVMVAGGFHTPGMVELMKKQGLSFVVITPDVPQHTKTDEKLYEERMLGSHLTPEQLSTGRDWAALLTRAPLALLSLRRTSWTFVTSRLFAPLSRRFGRRARMAFTIMALAGALSFTPAVVKKAEAQTPKPAPTGQTDPGEAAADLSAAFTQKVAEAARKYAEGNEYVQLRNAYRQRISREGWIGLLKSDYSVVVGQAILALAERGDISAIPDILDALKSFYFEGESQKALKAFFDKDRTLQKLQKAAQSAKDSQEKSLALRRLANLYGAIFDVRYAYVPEPTVTIARNALNSPEPEDRRAAIELLATIHPANAVIWILPNLKDPDPDVRKTVYAVLSNEFSSDPQAAPLAIRLLFSEVPEERIAALEILKNVKSQAALIEQKLKDSDLAVARRAHNIVKHYFNGHVSDPELAPYYMALDDAWEKLEGRGADAIPALLHIIQQSDPRDSRRDGPIALLLKVVGVDPRQRGGPVVPTLITLIGEKRETSGPALKLALDIVGPDSDQARKIRADALADSFAALNEADFHAAADFEKIWTYGDSAQREEAVRLLFAFLKPSATGNLRAFDLIWEHGTSADQKTALERLLSILRGAGSWVEIFDRFNNVEDAGKKALLARFAEESLQWAGNSRGDSGVEFRVRAWALRIQTDTPSAVERDLAGLRKAAWAEKHAEASHRGSNTGYPSIDYPNLHLFRQIEKRLTSGEQRMLWGTPWDPGPRAFGARHPWLAPAVIFVSLIGVAVYSGLLALLDGLTYLGRIRPRLPFFGAYSSVKPGNEAPIAVVASLAWFAGILLTFSVLYGELSYTPKSPMLLIAFALPAGAAVDGLAFFFIGLRLLLSPFVYLLSLRAYYREDLRRAWRGMASPFSEARLRLRLMTRLLLNPVSRPLMPYVLKSWLKGREEVQKVMPLLIAILGSEKQKGFEGWPEIARQRGWISLPFYFLFQSAEHPKGVQRDVYDNRGRALTVAMEEQLGILWRTLGSGPELLSFKDDENLEVIPEEFSGSLFEALAYLELTRLVPMGDGVLFHAWRSGLVEIALSLPGEHNIRHVPVSVAGLLQYVGLPGHTTFRGLGENPKGKPLQWRDGTVSIPPGSLIDIRFSDRSASSRRSGLFSAEAGRRLVQRVLGLISSAGKGSAFAALPFMVMTMPPGAVARVDFSSFMSPSSFMISILGIVAVAGILPLIRKSLSKLRSGVSLTFASLKNAIAEWIAAPEAEFWRWARGWVLLVPFAALWSWLVSTNRVPEYLLVVFALGMAFPIFTFIIGAGLSIFAVAYGSVRVWDVLGPARKGLIDSFLRARERVESRLNEMEVWLGDPQNPRRSAMRQTGVVTALSAAVGTISLLISHPGLAAQFLIVASVTVVMEVLYWIPLRAQRNIKKVKPDNVWFLWVFGWVSLLGASVYTVLPSWLGSSVDPRENLSGLAALGGMVFFVVFGGVFGVGMGIGKTLEAQKGKRLLAISGLLTLGALESSRRFPMPFNEIYAWIAGGFFVLTVFFGFIVPAGVRAARWAYNTSSGRTVRAWGLIRRSNLFRNHVRPLLRGTDDRLIRLRLIAVLARHRRLDLLPDFAAYFKGVPEELRGSVFAYMNYGMRDFQGVDMRAVLAAAIRWKQIGLGPQEFWRNYNVALLTLLAQKEGHPEAFERLMEAFSRFLTTAHARGYSNAIDGVDFSWIYEMAQANRIQPGGKLTEGVLFILDSYSSDATWGEDPGLVFAGYSKILPSLLLVQRHLAELRALLRAFRIVTGHPLQGFPSRDRRYVLDNLPLVFVLARKYDFALFWHMSGNTTKWLERAFENRLLTEAFYDLLREDPSDAVAAVQEFPRDRGIFIHLLPDQSEIHIPEPFSYNLPAVLAYLEVKGQEGAERFRAWRAGEQSITLFYPTGTGANYGVRRSPLLPDEEHYFPSRSVIEFRSLKLSGENENPTPGMASSKFNLWTRFKRLLHKPNALSLLLFVVMVPGTAVGRVDFSSLMAPTSWVLSVLGMVGAAGIAAFIQGQNRDRRRARDFAKQIRPLLAKGGGYLTERAHVIKEMVTSSLHGISHRIMRKRTENAGLGLIGDLALRAAA